MTGPGGIFRVDGVQPLVLPASSSVTREPPRPDHLRQVGYLEAFDQRTIAYDAFVHEATTFLIGPPLLNLTVDGPGQVAVTQFGLPGPGYDKTARISLPATRQAVLDVSGHRLSGPTGTSDWTVFANRRVLVTMSRDNDLDWIRDWAAFHVGNHGADAVLLYDNGSAYGAEAVAQTLAGVPGLEVGVVVDWPFPYGPQGGPSKAWDSDFAQVGSLEHARRKYLGAAAGVMNGDVDELVVSPRPVFEYAAEHGAVVYGGVWISNVREPSTGPVYRDYPFREAGAEACPGKWCINPRQLPDEAWLGVHWPFGAHVTRPEEIVYRHFRAVGTSWKYDRNRDRGQAGPGARDLELAAALDALPGQR